MSAVFRDLLKKVGSGLHTSKSMTRSEAELATRLMLTQEATPAQIGAFMIAHRIRRPTSAEVAGLLDAYETLGPRIEPIETELPVLVLGSPFDGRARTAPVAPLVALVLAAAQCPVLMHGGKTMPTKYGVPLVQLWQQLGLDWTGLSLEQLRTSLAKTGLGLVYLPTHFPLAEGLTIYREELGKRPPLATLELVWNAYQGRSRLVVGYVHPPTEERLLQTLAMRGCEDFIMVKGLEGSCDLPRDRTAIISLHQRIAPGPGDGEDPGDSQGNAEDYGDYSHERLLLHPQDYDLGGTEVAYGGIEPWTRQAHACLGGEAEAAGLLWPALLWNAGFYLWQMKVAVDLREGIHLAQALLTSGKAAAQLALVQQQLASQV